MKRKGIISLIMLLVVLLIIFLFFKFPLFYCTFEYSDTYENNEVYKNDTLYLGYYPNGELALQIPEKDEMLLVKMEIYNDNKLVWSNKYNQNITKDNFKESNENFLPNYTIEKNIKIKKYNNLKIIIEYEKDGEKYFFTSTYKLLKRRPFCNGASGG